MKRVIICGSAACLFDDLYRADILCGKKCAYDVACINHTALYYPYFMNYWISWHPELFQDLMQFVKGSPITYGPRKLPGVDHVKTFDGFQASDSSLYAVKVMLELEYEKIILCGSPMDNSRKFYSPYNAEQPQHEADNLQEAWREEAKGFEDRVRSMSGNTAKLLGEPDLGWLNV
jgi:hypothetical protein